jgi:hypothetical protein
VREKTLIGRWTWQVLGAFLLLCAFGGGAVGGQGSSGAATPTLTLTAYLQELDRWSAQLTQAGTRPQDLAALRRELPPQWRVSAGAAPVEVSTEWLRYGLVEAEKNPKTSAKFINHLLTHLQAMRGEAEALADMRTDLDGSAPAKLHKILARPEFRRVEGPSWLDRKIKSFVARLYKLLEELSDKLAGHERIQKSFRLIPWILLIAGCGVLLVWMTLRFLKRAPRHSLHLQFQEAIPERSWERIRQQAREAAARNEFREAIRLAYLAALHRLADLKLWKVDPTRTHREYLRLVRQEQIEHEPLALLTRQFELACYSAHPVTQGDFDTAVSQLERLGCV